MDRVGLLAIRAQKMLAGGQQACLYRRGAAALHKQPGFDIGLPADQPGQIRAGLVIADN